MAKKKRRKGCAIEDCPNGAVEGARVCREHLHPVALQNAYERARDGSLEGLSRLLRFDPYRRATQILNELDRRATPLKGANTEVVSRSRSHNLGDGIVAIGDNVATPAQGVSTYRDRARLGAAVSLLEEYTAKLERIADPKSKPTTRRCGSRSCLEPNRRQSIEHRYCGYCGREFRKRKE